MFCVGLLQRFSPLCQACPNPLLLLLCSTNNASPDSSMLSAPAQGGFRHLGAVGERGGMCWYCLGDEAQLAGEADQRCLFDAICLSLTFSFRAPRMDEHRGRTPSAAVSLTHHNSSQDAKCALKQVFSSSSPLQAKTVAQIPCAWAGRPCKVFAHFPPVQIWSLKLDGSNSLMGSVHVPSPQFQLLARRGTAKSSRMPCGTNRIRKEHRMAQVWESE